VDGGEATLERERRDMEDVFLEAVRGDDFLGVQTYTRVRIGPDGPRQPAAGARVTQMGWPSAGFLRLHFLGSVVGIVLVFFSVTAAGLVQGFKFNNATVPIVDAIKATVPFLGVATLGWLVLLGAQVLLAVQLGWLVVRLCAPAWRSVLTLLKSTGPSEAEVRP